MFRKRINVVREVIVPLILLRARLKPPGLGTLEISPYSLLNTLRLKPCVLYQSAPSPCAFEPSRPPIRNLGGQGRSSTAKNKVEIQGPQLFVSIRLVKT